MFTYRVWPLLAGHQVSALAQEMAMSGREGALILVDYVSGKNAEELRRHGLNYLDRLGNAWIMGQGLHISVQGMTPTREKRTARTLKPRTGVRLVFLFLKYPAAVAWTYRRIAKEAGVSLGSVGQTVELLRQQDFLQAGADGTLRLGKVEELRRQWEGWYSERLRPTLDRGRFRITGARSLEQLGEEVKNAGPSRGILVGGELAAARLTGYLRPGSVALHINKGDTDAVARLLRLVPDKEGPVQLLEWIGAADRYEAGDAEAWPLADPLLVRAELLTQSDERLRETARLIEERFLKRTPNADPTR